MTASKPATRSRQRASRYTPAFSAGDAICGSRTGQRAAGADHAQAIALLAQAGREGKDAARLLSQLMPLKNRAEYEPQDVPKVSASRAVGRPSGSSSMSTLMVTRKVLASAGGFTSPLARHPPTAEHVDLFIRLTSRAAVVVVPELLVDCRHHSGERNSDLQGTVLAADEAAEVLAGLAPELEGNPRQRAWLCAWVGARRLLVGDRRQGLAQMRTACAVAGPGTGTHIVRAYAPFVVKQLVASSRR